MGQPLHLKLGLGLLVVFSITLTVPAFAQGSPSIDLEKYFFASPEAEKQQRSDIETALANLESYKGKAAQSPENLATALQIYDALQKVFLKHANYLRLRCALDRTEKESCKAELDLYNMVEGREVFLKNEILGLGDEELSQLIGADKSLQGFSFAMAAFRRQRGHILSGPEEKLLSTLSPLTSEWQYDLYNQALDTADFGTVPSPDGPLDVLRDRAAIVYNRDGGIRKAGFEKLWLGYNGIRDDLAFALLHIAEAGNALAKARNFKNAPDEKYFGLFLDPGDTRALLGELAKYGALYKRFEAIRNADLKVQYKLESPGVWDEYLPPKALKPFTFSEARKIFHNAFGGLGTPLQNQFDALLDPANGRVDVALEPRENRYGGGFSAGISGIPSMLFVGRFNGAFKDLSVIAHEGGHAVHRQFMADNGTKPVYQSGPNFMFESFAVFNELVLADYMTKKAETPEEKRYYLEQFLSIKGLDFLLGAKDAGLEQVIYDGVASGTLANADDLDALTFESDKNFSMWPAEVPALKARWEPLVLAYEDPLYYINYVYAGLLGLEYFQLWKKDQAKFNQAYTALLENGFDAPPAELLEKFLRINLHDQKTLVANAASVVDKILEELEE